MIGLEHVSTLQSYDTVLAAVGACSLPLQPVVARAAALHRHGESPFWWQVKREAIPLLRGFRFP